MRSPFAGGRVWLDGRIVEPREATVPLTDPGILAGVGVFETLAVRHGRLLDVEAHLERLAGAASRLRVALPESAALLDGVRNVADSLPSPSAWLKIVAVRSGHTIAFGGEANPGEEGSACSAVLLPWTRSRNDPLAGLKTLNYAAFTLGLELAARRGAQEGLWRNERGHLVEACTANLFAVSRRRVFTPARSDGILPGVTRALALRAARDMGLVVHEGKVRLPRLRGADEAFLTSSVRGVRPLVRFDGRPVGAGVPGPVCLEISRRVRDMRRVDRGPGAA